jgi:UDP-2,3-diacylglucosamine pyrophosphatase LpxH
MSGEGTKVYYITGNHDDFLRRFSDTDMGNIALRDKLVLQVGGKRIWFFHGDIFDASIIATPLLARLGGNGYDWLIRINRLLNKIRQSMNKEPYSFSGKIKASVKQAVKFIQDFENKAIEVAAEKGFDVVVCGHIHQPQNKLVKTAYGEIQYLNAGDWIENLSALEYRNQRWNLYVFDENDYPTIHSRLHVRQKKQEKASRSCSYAFLYKKIVESTSKSTEELHSISFTDSALDSASKTWLHANAQGDIITTEELS